MLDFALLERQIERQRRQVWRIRAMACAVVGVAVFSYAEIGMYAYGIPALQRRLLALLVAVPLSALILLVFHTVLQLSGKVAHAVLHPSAGGPPVVSTSAAEALFTQGKIDASIEAFDALRQIHGQAPDLLRREADLHLGRDGRPERARELLIRLRQSPSVSRGDELFATQRLIDLYFGSLNDEPRALSEMRRLVERFPGTRDAEGARAELERRRQRTA